MGRIQLPLNEKQLNEREQPTSCLPGFLRQCLGQTSQSNPSSSSFDNFVYSPVDPMSDLPTYKDVVESMQKLNIQCDDEITKVINQEIDAANEDLRKISLDLHEHPETGMKEFHAHDVLTEFLEKHGFKVTRHAYDIKTAFMAEYSRGSGRRIGICSEYDALPGLGQGCGHNLIAISGLASAIGIKAALEHGKASGKVVLFGTPAEELSIGKILLCQKRAFQDNVDVCLMLHPTAYDHQYASFIAVNDVKVEFFGKASHAAGAPWEGVNALDAIVQVWNNISMMRQQLEPTDRVHGIVTDGGVAANVIPDYTSAFFFVRTTRASQLERVMKKLEDSFEAAAIATGCKVKYTWREIGVTKDVVQNKPLSDHYAYHMKKYGIKFPSKEDQERAAGGSTDMGNVSYELPCIHPTYGIDTDASNHTIEFTEAAKTPVAHKNTLRACKCLAATGVEVLLNDDYFNSIQDDFKNQLGK